MGWNNQSVFQLIIIESGTPGSGLFVYNGVGAPGNPPILAITTASADPFGNAVAANAITDTGMPLLMYVTAPGAGNLRTSLSPAAGSTTDSFGNTVEPGFFNGNLGVAGAGFVNIANGLITFGISSQIAGGLEAGIIAGQTPGITEIFGDFASGTDVQTVLQIQSKANGGSLIISQAGLDANSYDTARKTLTGPPSGQTVSSTTFATVTGLSASVAAGHYVARVFLNCTQGGGAFAVATEVTGPATSLVSGYTLMVEGIANGLYASHLHTGLPSNLTGPAFGAGNNFVVTMELNLNFTAAGTLAVQVAQGVAGHNWFVNTGSFIELMPVTT